MSNSLICVTLFILRCGKEVYLVINAFNISLLAFQPTFRNGVKLRIEVSVIDKYMIA